MRKVRHITVIVSLAFVLAWISGCGGCSAPPEPASLSPMEGPETGGTSVRITGEKFDMKKSVIVTFGGKNATSISVPSKTEITAQTPAGTAGESVSIVVTNNSKPENPVTMTQKFTYTDATPPTVTAVEPADNTVISTYDDSLNVRNSVSITYSENVSGASINVQVESTPDSLSKESGMPSGNTSSDGNSLTFTSDKPMRAGRKYTVSVSGAKDAAGNASESHTFSFTIASPKLVTAYIVRKGEKTLEQVASRPEVYDNSSRAHQIRLATANQDDYDFSASNLRAGQRLWVPRQADSVWK